MSTPITIYGTSWCPHCTSAKTELAAHATFVDCDKNRDLCERAGVKAYPTIVGANGQSVEGFSTAMKSDICNRLGVGPC